MIRTAAFAFLDQEAEDKSTSPLSRALDTARIFQVGRELFAYEPLIAFSFGIRRRLCLVLHLYLFYRRDGRTSIFDVSRHELRLTGCSVRAFVKPEVGLLFLQCHLHELVGAVLSVEVEAGLDDFFVLRRRNW